LKGPSDRVRAAAAALRRAALAACAAGTLGAVSAARAGAQPPTPAPAPAPRDTLRTDSTRVPLDSARRATSDSAARDSAVAQAMQRTAGDPTVFGQLGIDRLRLSAIGASGGIAWPRRTLATRLYGVQADYGEIAPRLRLVFTGSYWSTHYTDGAVRGLENAVAAATGVDTVRFGRIRTSDLALAADLRFRPGARRGAPGGAGAIQPFIAAGPALHFLDTEGLPLNDTFVEQALDGVALGLGAGAGLDAALLPNMSLTMHVRYDLFSGAHFASLRAGGSYRFDAAPVPARMRRALRSRA
jgi:opacity protein-like surface antigen